MKKVKLILIAGAVIFFTACSSGSGGHRDPIDRNVELTVDSTRELSIPCTINASEFAGKKAFIVVQNNSKTNSAEIMNTSGQTNEIVQKYKNNIREKGRYTNIPYKAPEILPLLTNSATRRSSAFINRDDNTTSTTVPVPTVSETYSSSDIGNVSLNFYAFTEDDTISETYAQGSVLKAIGTHCNVWYKSKSGIDVKPNQFQSLANNFDAIYEKETYIFGSNKIIPKNDENNVNLISTSADKPKVNILVYDLFDDYLETKNNGYGTFGYFTFIDLVKNNTLRANPNPKTSSLKSNECQCVHIDSYFLSVAAAQVYSTLGHEFQHLLNFVNKTANKLESSSSPLSDGSRSETWFNEMMSMVCEDIMLTQLNLPVAAGPQSRLNIFNKTYYYGFKLWLDDEDVLISYANAYAFGAYLLRNYGINAIRSIATNSYNNEEAISQAIGISFDTIFKNFYNVILNPKASNYTLNKPVSATYTINGSSVTFNCAAINLFDYQTLEASEIDYNTVKYIYQAEINQNYYGPIIFRNTVDSVGPRGTWVMNINGSVALDNSFNASLKYYLVITQ